MILPSGWQKCKLSDIASVRNGYAFSKKIFSHKNNDNQILLIKQTQLSGNKVDLSKACYLPNDYLMQYNDFIVNKNDVLIGMSGSIGKLCIYQYEFPALQNQRTGLIKKYTDDIDNKFFWFFLQTIEAILLSDSKGVGVQNINANDIEDIVINLPPLPEQNRIIAKIDSLFSELDSNVTLLKNVKTQLSIYRKSVLKWAFEGKLTDSSLLKNDYLEKYIEKPRYGTSKKCLSNNIGKKVYRIPNIHYQSGTIVKDDIKFAKFSKDEIKVLKLNKDDILIIRSNGSVNLVGRASIVREGDTDGLFAGYLMRLRILNNTLDPKYLLYYLSTIDARNYIEFTAKSTSGVNNINSEEVCKIKLPYFDLPEQLAIVSAIESRLSVCDKIEQTIDQTIAISDQLRQSILKKAFEGRLVPQDPNDEPAEKLLERIKAEKAAILEKKKTDHRVKRIKKKKKRLSNKTNDNK